MGQLLWNGDHHDWTVEHFDDHCDGTVSDFVGTIEHCERETAVKGH